MTIAALPQTRRTHPSLRKLALAAVLLGILLLPELAFDVNLLRGEPTASGAEPAYPLNHAFDADIQPVGTPPTNNDFEATGYSVGTPPANSNFQAAATSSGTPTNYDFASGALTPWTATGTVTIQSDPNQGNYARFDSSSATITTDAFTVANDAQSLSFDIGLLSTTGSSWVIAKVLSGADYGTIVQVGSYSCNSCGTWKTQYVDATGYRGQSIKLFFLRGTGSQVSGVDTAQAQIHLPSFDLVGQAGQPLVARRTEAGGNVYAALEAGTPSHITSSAFTVDSASQSASVQVKGVSSGADQYKIQVLSGTGFATTTDIVTATAGDSAWETTRFSVASWLGAQIKIRVSRVSGATGIDMVGEMRVDVPSWTVTADTRAETGGPTGNYVSTNGQLTSTAFTIPSTVQQLTIRHKGANPGASFYLELLRGPTFSTVTDLAGNVVEDTVNWKTLRVSVQPYAGETVKLRVRQYFNRGYFDTAGPMEITIPGWTMTTTDPVDVGEDANGTYVKPGKQTFYLQSSTIDSGIVDAPFRVDQKYFSVSYDIGYQTGALVRVTWYPTVGNSIQVFIDAADTPTGYKTGYFYLADFMGTTGYFLVQVVDAGGKVYNIAENAARQQLQEPTSQKVGSGVDTSTGGFAYVDKDLQLGGTVPLNFTRFHTAHSDRYGTLGYRWSHSYDTRLEFGTNGDVGVVYGSGGQTFFKHTSGTYTTVDPRMHDELVKNGDGTYAYKTKINFTHQFDASGNPIGVNELDSGNAAGVGYDASGRADTITGQPGETVNFTYNFSAAGKLTSIVDLKGNTTTLVYDGSSRLDTVTDSESRVLDLAYDGNGRLTSVTAPAGAVVEYAYDANGDLVSVTDPNDGVRTYAYNKHRLTTATDQRGKVLFTNTYDSVHRVTGQTDAANNSIAIAYDNPAKGATRVTDPLNNVAKYYFDKQHRTTDKVDPLGHVVTYIFDSLGQLQKVVDPVNNQWQFTYDSAGGLTQMLDPLGHAITVAYNPLHLPTTVTDARGNTTTMTYDAEGNMLTLTDPLNKTWSATYDGAGRVLTVTNPLNQTESYTYDAAGNMLTRTNALGKTWTYTYDGHGRTLSETDPTNRTWTWTYQLGGQIATEINPLNGTRVYGYAPNGALVLVDDELGSRTLWTYDDRGLPISKTDPANKVTTYAYDADHRLTSETDPLNRTTSYTYTSDGRLATMTDPAGGVLTYTYTTGGYLASEKDPLNRTTSYAYDSAGRVLTVTMPNTGVWTYQYDNNGNLIVETNPLNHSTTYIYDANNRRTRVTDPLLNQTNYTFDGAGRMTEVKDALNQSTTFAYDAAGQLLSTTDPLSAARSFTYDNAGRRITSVDPLNRTTTYGYDLAGRLTSAINAAGKTTTYGYDAAGRRTSVTEPLGGVTSYVYDPRGLLLSVTNPLLHVTSYAYDNAGQQVSMTDARNYTTTYAYDGAGRQTTLTDTQGGVVTFAYDLAGQRTGLTNARGKTATFTYDALRNMLTETDPLAQVRSWTYDLAGQNTSYTDGRNIAQVYSYDVAGRQTSVAYPGGSVVYGYDAIGRQTSMVDVTGTTTRTYDAASRITSVASPQGTVSYTYNTAGQRASMTLPGSRMVTYGYDTGGRLSTLTDWLSNVTTFTYDDNSRRTAIVHPNGVTSGYTYDAANRVTTINHTGPSGTLLVFTNTYDANGNRTSVVKNGGAPESYTLDSLNRLTGVTYADGTTQSYTYDANGNRLTRTQGGATTTYTYNNGDQLTSDGTSTYAYDNNGNITARGSDTFSYDHASRMTGATIGGTAATYAYDGEDTRVSKSVTGTPTTYLWDRESGLPLLVDDGIDAYLHAGGVVGEIAGANREDLLPDGLGSVRGVSGSTGTLVGSRDFDAYGAPRSTSGATSNFAFTGEQLDLESGFTYLRARYLDPAVGRFGAVDSIVPNAPGTQGFNPYGYVAGNPVRWTDPSGHGIIEYVSTHKKEIYIAGAAASLAIAIVQTFDRITCALRTDCREYWTVIDNEWDVPDVDVDVDVDVNIDWPGGGGDCPDWPTEVLDAITETLEAISSNNKRFPQDGTTHGNKEGHLPAQTDREYYKEWKVDVKGDTTDRFRIVKGNGGELYFTDTHYGSSRWSHLKHKPFYDITNGTGNSCKKVP